MIFYILAAILLLGIMVTVHEFGHFMAARLTGIPVKEFAIGFGPQILSWSSKKYETKFFLRCIPMGGYCAFYGEDDTEEKEKDDQRNLNNFAVWKRLLTILMGPVMNFVLALVVAVGIYCAVGVDRGGEYGYYVVQSVESASPAEKGGLQAGDIILAINGQDMKGLDADETPRTTNAIMAYRPGDEPLKMDVEREGERVTLYLTPEVNEAEGRMMVGITMQLQYTPDFQPISVFEAVGRGFDYCVRSGRAILDALLNLVRTGEGLKESSGPVGIVQLIAEETKENGFITYAELLVLISVNLGLFNLLPIPGLDGSRLIFLAIEGIFRKPVPRKIEAYIHMAGYLVLIGFMLFVTFQDVQRIFR